MSIKWKSIYAHSWDKTLSNGTSLYDLAIIFIKNGYKFIEEYGGLSSSFKHTFSQRLKYDYKYDETKDQLYVEDPEAPRWSSLANFHGGDSYKYYVIRPEKREEVLMNYMDNVEKLSISRDGLFDKVLRDRHLGISKEYVTQFLKQQDLAQKILEKFKKPVIKSYRPLYPMQHWQMDLIDMQNFGRQNRNYKWILVVVDIFSKYLYMRLLPTKDTNNVVIALKNIFMSGDIPERLQCDNDSTFTSNNVKDILKELSIYQIVNPSYSPQTNGFVENKNKSIKNLINAHFVAYQTRRYYDIVDKVAFTLNNTRHSVTKLTPQQVHRGYENRLVITDPVQVRNIQEDQIDQPEAEVIQQYYDHAKDMYKVRTNTVRERIDTEAHRRERYLGERVFFEPGDMVRVATFFKTGEQYQGIELYGNPENPDRQTKKYQDKDSLGIKLRTVPPKKFKNQFYSQKFVVDSRSKYDKNGKYVYRIYEYNPNSMDKVFAEYSLDNRVVSRTQKFFSSQLYRIRNIQKEFKELKPVKYSDTLFHVQGSIPQNRALPVPAPAPQPQIPVQVQQSPRPVYSSIINQQPQIPVQVYQSVLNQAPQQPQIPVQVQELPLTVSDIKKILESSKLRKEARKLKIEIFQVFRFIQGGNSKLVKVKGTIKGFSKQKNKESAPWFIKFTDEENELYSELSPDKYSYEVESEGTWHFADETQVKRKFVRILNQ